VTPVRKPVVFILTLFQLPFGRTPSILTATCNKLHHQHCQKLMMATFHLPRFFKSLRSRWNRIVALRKQLCDTLPTPSNPKTYQGSLLVVAQITTSCCTGQEEHSLNPSSERECNMCVEDPFRGTLEPFVAHLLQTSGAIPGPRSGILCSVVRMGLSQHNRVHTGGYKSAHCSK
jgi:hypothetical protein